MELTAQQLANIANATMDFYLKGKPIAQSLQDKPTLQRFRSGQKTFPGNKESIRGNVKGDYTTEFIGYTGDDTVTYGNPANIKQFNWPWFELHGGISLTHSELKKNGISVVDTNGERTSNHSQRDMVAISNILEDKLDDMKEGLERSFNSILWRDGSQSSLVFPGITSIIREDPTTGIIAGIDSALNPWWRNRAKCGSNKITHSTTSQTLTKTLRSEVRQLRRYGGRPTYLPAGSGFIEKLEAEVFEKGTYTQEGFKNNGQTDIGMADISMRGVGSFVYDPTLDDLGMNNFALFVDPRHIMLQVMDGEDMKQHSPARPASKYVLYRGVTWTGTLMANKLNAHGIYEAA